MRAVAVPRFRAPAVLTELPIPKAGTNELVVRVEFAGINPFDWKIADGIFEGSRPHVFPLILGIDAAGTVESTGEGVTRLRPGDRVVGSFLHDPVGLGTYSEFAVVPETNAVASLPPGLPSDQGAALPTAGMTALASLEMLALPAGATLLITGASGGVGSFATELAAARGARVTAVARESSAARLRSFGAEGVIDPTQGDPYSAVHAQFPAGVDGLLDLMSDRTTFPRWAACVRPGATAATTTFSADPESLKGRVRAVNINLQPTTALLERLIRSVIDDHLRVPLERTVRLEESADALGELRSGRGHGKTVVNPRM